MATNDYYFEEKSGCNGFVRTMTNSSFRMKLNKSNTDYLLEGIGISIQEYIECMNKLLKINIILETKEDIKKNTNKNFDDYYIFRLDLKNYKNSIHRYYAFCIIRHLYYYENVIIDFFKYKTDDDNYNLTLLSCAGTKYGGYSFFNKIYNFNNLSFDEYLKKALEQGNAWLDKIHYNSNIKNVKETTDEVFNVNVKDHIKKINNYITINLIDKSHFSYNIIINNFKQTGGFYLTEKKILHEYFNDSYTTNSLNSVKLETIKISDNLSIVLYCQYTVVNTKLILKNNNKKQILIETNNDKITFDKRILSKYNKIIINLNRLKPEIISDDKNTRIINSNFHNYKTKTFLKNRLQNSSFSYVNKDKLKRDEEMFYAVIINGNVVDSNYKNLDNLKNLSQILKLEVFNVEFIERNGDINIYSVNSKNLNNNKENIQKICVD